MNFLQQKLCLVLKPLSICLGMLGHVGDGQSAGIDD
jgi:hypothetical protein